MSLLKGGDLAVTLLGNVLSFTTLHRSLFLYCVNALTEEDVHELHMKVDHYSTLKSAPAFTYNFYKDDFESFYEELELAFIV